MIFQWVSYSWNDDDCIKILGKCRNGISANSGKGKVIIIDVVTDQKHYRNEMTNKLLWAVVMMAGLNGRERGEEDWKKLLLGTGIQKLKIFPIFVFTSLIRFLLKPVVN